jgi:alkyl hydroperoxide reductase subunit D
MPIERLKDQLPDFARDLKFNLSNLIENSSLTKQQLWGTALTSAVVSHNARVARVIADEAETHLTAAAYRAAEAAAAMSSMNNIYYRFIHTGDGRYAKLPSKLRMNVLTNLGVEEADFHLFSIAASAINGCVRCMERHEREAVKAGVPTDTVLDVVRVASVIHGIAVTLEAQQAEPESAETIGVP